MESVSICKCFANSTNPTADPTFTSTLHKIFKNEHKRQESNHFKVEPLKCSCCSWGTFWLPPPSCFLSSLCPQLSPPSILVVYLVVWPQPHCSRHQDKINNPVFRPCCPLVLSSRSSLFMLWNARFNNSSFTLEDVPMPPTTKAWRKHWYCKPPGVMADSHQHLNPLIRICDNDYLVITWWSGKQCPWLSLAMVMTVSNNYFSCSARSPVFSSRIMSAIPPPHIKMSFSLFLLLQRL